jgi:SAM-dependent methyltransferase
MNYFSIPKHFIPKPLSIKLFGNRGKFGKIPIENDQDWMNWERIASTFYSNSQKKGIGNVVNNAGYKNLKSFNFKDKKILEIGPGDIKHQNYWKSKPKTFTIIDVDRSMAAFAEKKLEEFGIHPIIHIVSRNSLLPIEDESIDVVVSFYSLEHIFEIEEYLKDIARVLKPGGILVGAIPAEGGVAWGLGRLLTTSRWLRKSHGLDLNKIICWEHPNFANDIIKSLDKNFTRISLQAWPLPFIPLIDVNLVIKFAYAKKTIIYRSKL